jgi:RNA polymerase sigma-70 factor (ECF subfamily)
VDWPTRKVISFDAAEKFRGRPVVAEASTMTAPAEHAVETLGRTYVRQYAAMKEFLRRRVGSADVAEELIQEAWVAIAPRADDPTIENPEAWLQRVVVNLALNWLKTSHVRSRFLQHDEESVAAHLDETPGTDRQLQYQQGLDYLKQLIDELPPGRRAAFLLCRGEGLSLKEAAARLQISVKTVSAQVTAAVCFLRERLIEAGLWP